MSHDPGTAPPSPLRLLRPGTKLLGLLLFGVVVIAVPGWIPALGALGVGLALALMAGLGTTGRRRELLRPLRVFIPAGALLFAFQWWQHGWERAVDVVAGLLALILAAIAVTASTSVDELLDAIVRALGPLRRLGVSPERVALAFALAIRSLPLAIEVAHETRAAARARGFDRSPRAFAVPFAVRMVRHARDTGAALHARGLGDD
ncbi:energy-coupling factor transporter transmembrane component T [Leucobacter soli]|uniref:Energy-coupling factor transporter transmembrane protein BioN n=1 Tax=Leucobacter soli TaxID=2812850 RepID=A0A916JZ83_9MICO|nr:energy-coupling factor transporter transmembrane component T [Leucobacter soli]CAG7608578.1 Energy-coupling factor transporter transmembrane protein BioN [Leucobacter soli]